MKLCSDCPFGIARPGQRTCKECHAKKQAERRAAEKSARVMRAQVRWAMDMVKWGPVQGFNFSFDQQGEATDNTRYYGYSNTVCSGGEGEHSAERDGSAGTADVRGTGDGTDVGVGD